MSYEQKVRLPDTTFTAARGYRASGNLSQPQHSSTRAYRRVPTTTTFEDTRHVMVLLLATAVLAACGGYDGEFSGYGRVSGDGRIRGVFHVGNRTVPDSRWVEMIELRVPPKNGVGRHTAG